MREDGGAPVENEVRFLSAEQRDQLVPDDARHFLRRRELLEDALADRLLLDARGELPDDGKGDVRFEQREADLPQRRLEVVFGQLPFAAQLLEDSLDPVAEPFEHPRSSCRPVGRDGVQDTRRGTPAAVDTPPCSGMIRGVFPQRGVRFRALPESRSP